MNLKVLRNKDVETVVGWGLKDLDTTGNPRMIGSDERTNLRSYGSLSRPAVYERFRFVRVFDRKEMK